MLLVGAKRRTIYNPFIFTGIIQGIWGSIFAILALIGIIYLAYSHTNATSIIDLSQPIYYIALFVILFVIGIFITWISTVFSVKKYIKMKIDKLYF